MEQDNNPTLAPQRKRFPARLQLSAPPTMMSAAELQQKGWTWLALTICFTLVLAMFALGNWIDRPRSPAQEELDAFAANAEAAAWAEGLAEGERRAQAYLDEQLRAAYRLGLQHGAQPAAAAASACRGGV